MEQKTQEDDNDVEIEVSPLTEDDLDEELVRRLTKYGWLSNKSDQ